MRPTSLAFTFPGMRPATVVLALLALLGADARRPLARVGVIEGFYGTPWSHQDRLDMLRFMGRVGLNMYVYAPKDDPYHRERWREAYPAAARQRLQQLVDSARTHGVQFWLAISPGGSMVYSDSADYAALLAKIDDVRRLGVTHFGLFLDDVPTTLSHPADRAVYGSLAAAHANLANRLSGDLAQRGAEMVLTPTTYTDAWGDRAYAAELGRLVHPSVPFFWTGVDVASPTVTAEQAHAWSRTIARAPWVWDNYPVNDYARWRPFLGPFTGRGPDLPGAIGGLAANPMNEAHLSMIALATLAQYALDPAAYDPALAQRTALEQLYGDRAATLLQPFLAAYGDYGWNTNVFEPLYIVRDTIDVTLMERTLERLRAALDSLRQIRSAGTEPLPPVVGELTPFVTATAQRLAAFGRDSGYQRLGGRLVYRYARDVHPADGAWRPLGRVSGTGGAAQIAFRAQGGRLIVRIRVPDRTPQAQGGHRIGTGDRVQLIVAADPSRGRHGLGRQDLVVVVAEDGAFVGHLKLEGFMSKWLADNERLTLSEFVMSTFAVADRGAGVGHAFRRTPDGYEVEITLPRGTLALRLSAQVTDVDGGGTVWSLARRAYPGNPAAFAEVP